MSVNIKENGQLVKTAGLNSQTVIIDNLTTQDATKALSAKQGYVLNQNKVDKVTGKGLSTNDYTNEDKAKVTSSDSKITNYEDRGYLGKNLLNPDNMGHYGRDNATGQINRTENSLSSTTDLVKVRHSTTYTIARNGTKYDLRVYFYDANKSYISNVVYNGTFTTPSNAEYIAFQSGYVSGALDLWCMIEGNSTTYEPYAKSNIELDATKIDKTASEIQTSDGQFSTVTGGLMQICLVDLEPIQSGSGTPSPSNVRAISGHTSVDVGNCGKNKFPYPYLFSSTTRTGMTITAQDDGKIAVTGTSTSSVVERIDVQYFTLDVGSYIISGLFPKTGCYATLRDGDTGSWIANIETNSYALNVASKKKYLIAINITSGNTTGVTYEPMIRKATDSADYEPYKGYTTTINLGGTYYGGTLDAVSGKFVATHVRVDLGSYTWGKTNANLFFTEYPRDFKKAVYASGFWYANGVCECYKFIQDSITSEDGVINLYFEETRSFYRMFVNDSSRYSLSASDFKTAVTGQYLVYELATPQTIQLTPQQLETLVGQNDVFVPLAGQTLDSLSYREIMAWNDVDNAKLDLTSVAPIEKSNTASKAYTAKQLFIKDNRLCQALTAISSGATFTENTNFKYTTLANIIEPLL